MAVLGLSGWAFYRLTAEPLGLGFAIFLLIGVIAFAPAPLLAYRGYALFRSRYILNRENLELHWGLRDESIPLTEIEWVRPIEDLAYPLPMPPGTLPGAVLGLRRHRDVGIVEFLASEKKKLLLVATARRVFAISPDDPAEFTQTFARAVELGSLAGGQPRSIYPSFVLAQAWESGLVRYFWLAALFLNIGLIVWVSLLIPTLGHVSFAFGPDRAANAVPSTQLVILPLLSVFLSLVAWGAGLYYYRDQPRRVLSLLIWAASALSGLCFLLAVLFIVSSPV